MLRIRPAQNLKATVERPWPGSQLGREFQAGLVTREASLSLEPRLSKRFVCFCVGSSYRSTRLLPRKRNWSGLMSVSNWQDLPNKAAKHPLLARFLILVFAMALGLGVIHEARLVGEVLIVLVRYTKHELGQLADVGRRLRDEFTTWETVEEKPEGTPTKNASRGP